MAYRRLLPEETPSDWGPRCREPWDEAIPANWQECVGDLLSDKCPIPGTPFTQYRIKRHHAGMSLGGDPVIATNRSTPDPWYIDRPCPAGYTYDAVTESCIPDEEDDEDLPLGEFTTTAYERDLPGDEGFEPLNTSDDNPIRVGFNRSDVQEEYVASVLPTFPLHSEAFSEVLDVPPVALVQVDGEGERTADSLVRGAGGDWLRLINPTVAGTASMAALAEVNNNVVQIGDEVADLGVALAAQVEWSNQVNHALKERIDALCRLVDTLGTTLLGDGWYDRRTT